MSNSGMMVQKHVEAKSLIAAMLPGPTQGCLSPTLCQAGLLSTWRDLVVPEDHDLFQ